MSGYRWNAATRPAVPGDHVVGICKGGHDSTETPCKYQPITEADVLELVEALRELEEREQRDEALLRQALEALEIMYDGLLQMEEHAEDYGKRWAAAYIKELRDLSPGSAKEKFDLLGILQDRLAAVSMGARKGYAAIIALRERIVKGKEQSGGDQ